MKPIERNILNKIIKNLEQSTKKDWYLGDMYDWNKYAKQMKLSIDNSIQILSTLTSETENIEQN